MTAVAIASVALPRVYERSPMNRLPVHVSALTLYSALTVEPSPADAGRLLGDVRPVAAAILSHRITAGGTISFSLRSKSLAVDEPETELANWLEDELTMPGLVVAYDLYNLVLPLLLRFIRPGQHYSLADLTAAPRWRVDDLCRPQLSFTPTPFETVCAQERIEIVDVAPPRDGAMVEVSVAEAIDDVVVSKAIATWRLWLNDFAMSTGEERRCNHAAACLDAELRLRSRPTADSVGRHFNNL